MPTNHDAVAAIASGAGRKVLITDMVYPIASAAAAQDLVAAYGVDGTIPALLLGGIIFRFDAADTTTAHDGITCLVSFDGKRYKTELITAPEAVEARTNTPPGSPSIGQWWIVSTAPTGAWAGKAENLAAWTARGWAFVAPRVGLHTFDKTTVGFWHIPNAGTWTQGLGSGVAAAGSIPAWSLTHAGLVAVENRTTNTPPGLPTSLTYIVGPAPTGAWAGHAGEVAIGNGGSWAFITPYEGMLVDDKSIKGRVRFTSGVWVDQRRVIARDLLVYEPGSITAGTGYGQISTTAPTTGQGTAEASTLSQTLAVAAAVNDLEFHYSAGFVPNTEGRPPVVALHVDGGVNAARWLRSGSPRFRYTPGDTASHTYSFRVHSQDTNAITVFQRTLVTREINK